MRIARWYCPTAYTTFSLLPDFLASRLSGELAAVEVVVAQAELCPSVEAAANMVRTDDITLPSAVRWVRRRLLPVRAALLALLTMMPELFAGGLLSPPWGCAPTVTAMRLVLGTGSALVVLREVGAAHLGALPPPLGFGPRRKGGW